MLSEIGTRILLAVDVDEILPLRFAVMIRCARRFNADKGIANLNTGQQSGCDDNCGR